MPRISFALPVFNEQSGIDAFHAGMTEALTARPDLGVEFVYVTDGSLDESPARLTALQRADAHIRIVDLSPQSRSPAGHHRGHRTRHGRCGCHHGHRFAVPAGCSLELVAAWERGADVVYAQRRKREDRRSSVVPPMNRTGRARLIGVIRCQPI